ncbi:MAG: PrsW family intramembrane metalloprotease [Anaerolineae bacterium]
MSILLGILLSLVVGGVSTALYAWLVWWLDHYEKEPWYLLALAFLWGALPAIVISLLVEVALDLPISVMGQGLAYDVASSSLLAPLIEEITKGLFVFGVVIFVRREMDSVLDGIVYGAMVGLGFAFTENILYFVGGLQEGGWQAWMMLVMLRAIIFGLNHAFFTSLTGGALGYARLSLNPTTQTLLPVLGLSAAVVFHGIHNLGATLNSVTCFAIIISLLSDWGGIIMVAVAIVLAWRQEKRWIETHLRSEVGTTFPHEVFELAVSYRKRLSVQFQALLRGDFKAWRLSRRLAQTATDLAFKKHQLAELGEEGGAGPIIKELRERLHALQSS